ncbi:MAG: T9SS type A sorting domain-containing protein [Cyclobacteriaceae bacterium]
MQDSLKPNGGHYTHGIPQCSAPKSFLKHCFLIVLIGLISIVESEAQTGPGGVGNTSGESDSGDLILWLDANQIDNVSPENNVTTWPDMSGNGYDAGPSEDVYNQNNKPNYHEDVQNGFPAISFNGSAEHLEGPFSDTDAFDAPFTIFSVAYFDVDQPDDDNDYVFSIGDRFVAEEFVSLSRRRGNDGTYPNYLYNYNGSGTQFATDGALNSTTWYVLGQTQSSSSTFLDLLINGASQTISADVGAGASYRVIDRFYTVGELKVFTSGTNNFLDGYVAEIIMYNGVLNSAQINIVQSYLAAKYDIPGGVTNDQYVGDNADPPGTPSDGDYDFDVAGIGTESDGNNNSAKSVGLNISQNTNFTTGEYLMFGHKLSENAINRSDISDLSGDIVEARWERIWFLDITDDGDLTADLEFDFSDGGFGHGPSGSASNYVLLFRESGVDWALTPANTISGNSVHFTNVALTTDGYYTLGTIDETNSPIGTEGSTLSDRGPAGIGDIDGSSSLELWLDAQQIGSADNDYILRWEDLSGNGADATRTSNLNLPRYDDTNSQNGLEVVIFDGTVDGSDTYVDDEHGGSPASMIGSLNSGLDGSDGITLAAVAYFDQDQASGATENDYVIGIGSSTNQDEHISISRRQNTGSDQNKYYSYDNMNRLVGPVIPTDQWSILVAHYESGTSHSFFLDGDDSTDPADYSGTISTNTDYNISRWYGGNANFMDGAIGEIIVFDQSMNDAQMIILHNYLSGKWGITLSGISDVYNGDIGANGNNDLDIAGVGRVDASNIHNSATSSGMQVTINSGFDDDDFLMFGHATADNSINDSDVNGEIDERWERAWWFDVTDASTAATIDILYDISEGGTQVFPEGDANNYKVLFSATGSAPWSSIASASSIANDQITFTNVTLNNGDGYYTLGTENFGVSPLPVELIAFDGKLIANRILLNWITATEINNAGFEVERSLNGETFKKIGLVNGNGNQATKQFYQFNDLNLKENTDYYYRLRQFDYDGQYEYSHAIHVAVSNLVGDFKVYPNPAVDIIKLEYGQNVENGHLRILNFSGQEVYTETISNQRVNEFPASFLSVGIYFIQLNIGVRRQVKKLIITK